MTGHYFSVRCGYNGLHTSVVRRPSSVVRRPSSVVRPTMRPNSSLAKIRNNQLALGLWFNSGNPILARLIAAQGCMDWLLIDTEHCATDLSTVSVLCSSIADVSNGLCSPLVRVVDGTVFHIKQALDAGAHGVMVPLVETSEQAARIVSYAKYPPMGVRGNGGIMPHLGFAANRAHYTEHANRETLVAVQIETKTAVANLDEIASVPGVDVLFIGPNDLHISLGYAPSYWSDAPLFRDAASAVVEAARKHNLSAGILMGGGAQAKARVADGFGFVGMAGETLLLLNAIGSGYAEVTGAGTPAGGWGSILRM